MAVVLFVCTTLGKQTTNDLVKLTPKKLFNVKSCWNLSKIAKKSVHGEYAYDVLV